MGIYTRILDSLNLNEAQSAVHFYKLNEVPPEEEEISEIMPEDEPKAKKEKYQYESLASAYRRVLMHVINPKGELNENL